MGVIGMIVVGAVAYAIQTYYPGLAKLIFVCFCASVAIMLVDPGAGAAFTLLWILPMLGFLVLLALPLVLAYVAGIAFICLFIIGLGQLLGAH